MIKYIFFFVDFFFKICVKSRKIILFSMKKFPFMFVKSLRRDSEALVSMTR